jgi:hypothetical protein
MACHQIGSAGGQIGPNLSGAGAMGLEAVLRNILTPNAAMEPGYRIYRVEMKNGDLIDAFFVSEDKDATIIRQARPARSSRQQSRHPQHEVHPPFADARRPAGCAAGSAGGRFARVSDDVEGVAPRRGTCQVPSHQGAGLAKSALQAGTWQVPLLV